MFTNDAIVISKDISIHLIWSEVVHHPFVHMLGVLLMIKALIHLLIEQHVWAVSREGHTMVHTGVSAHVAWHVHICTVWWISDLRNVPQVSDLHVRLFAGVRRMKSLIIAKSV